MTRGREFLTTIEAAYAIIYGFITGSSERIPQTCQKLSKIIRSSYAYGEDTHNTTPHYAILLYTAKGEGAMRQKAMGREGGLANKEQFAVLRQSPELVVNPHL